MRRQIDLPTVCETLVQPNTHEVKASGWGNDLTCGSAGNSKDSGQRSVARTRERKALSLKTIHRIITPLQLSRKGRASATLFLHSRAVKIVQGRASCANNRKPKKAVKKP
eukprot:1534565-Pleurochrysis_carterae.AAC.1